MKTDLVRIEPNRMADAVPCTARYDFRNRHSRRAVSRKCLGCHEAPYLMSEWTMGFDQDVNRTAAVVKRAETTRRKAGEAAAQVGRP